MAYKAGGNFQKRGWRGGSRKGHPTTQLMCWEQQSSFVLEMAASLQETLYPSGTKRERQKPEDLMCAGQCITATPGSSIDSLLASLFSEGTITNEEGFNDQINQWQCRITNDEMKTPRN